MGFCFVVWFVCLVCLVVVLAVRPVSLVLALVVKTLLVPDCKTPMYY